MTISTNNRRFSYLGTLAIAAISLVAMALPLTPAKAQIGFQVGPFGFGIGAPAPAYTYPAYAYPAYGYPYYRAYPYPYYAAPRYYYYPGY
jgi:hypothetical protein